MFTKICQRDYPKLFIGKGISFYRYGCLTCVVNMAYNWLYGKNKTPNQIVPKLKYLDNGMLTWDLSGIKMKLYASTRRTSTYNARKMIDRWWSSQNVCCALEVKNGVHFVWQIGRWWPGLGYRIVDPIDGRKKWLKYNITGCRIVGRK